MTASSPLVARGSRTGGESYNVFLTLQRSARRYPTKVAVVDSDGRRYSYAQLEEDARKVSAAFAAKGIAPGDKVGVVLPNSYAFVVVLYGLAHAGIVLIPLNPAYTRDELGYVLSDAGVSAVVTSDGSTVLGMDLGGHDSGVPTVRHVILADDLLRSQADVSAAAAAAVPEGTPHSILYTSGTTGRPKGAMISHRSRMVNGASCVIGYGFTEEDSLWIPIPLFHSGGMFLGLMSCIAAGAAVVLSRGADPEIAVRLLSAGEINAMIVVPTIVYRLLAHEGWRAAADGTLRRIIVGGAAMPADTANRLLRALPDIRCYGAYGSTEAPQLTVLDPAEFRSDPTRTGRPLPYVEVRVVDGDGIDVGPGSVGEIVTRGPHLFDGYLGRPELDVRSDDGWYRLGDLATLHADGTFSIVGRTTEMIVSGGFNVYAREVEEVLYTHPAISEVAVIGLPDAEWGEVVAAAVVPAEPSAISRHEVIQHAKAHLAGYKTPREVFIVDQLPHTPVGKIRKSGLSAQFAALRAGDADTGE